MSDRLKELQRQRALAQEQLDWLDREIAAAGGSANPTGSPTVSIPTHRPLSRVPFAPATAVRSSTNPATAAQADELIAKYASDAGSLKSEVKRGCFLYFAIGLLLLGAAVLVLYFYTTRR